MYAGLQHGLETERHDVFDVTQITRGTALETLVGADLVHVAAHEESGMHRHNNAETVLYITSGAGAVVLNATCDVVPVAAGDRLVIPKGVFHAVRTGESELTFISVQCPPILDRTTGFRDLEEIDGAVT